MPPEKPPGPPSPPGAGVLPTERTAFCPLTSIVPAMLISPVANMVTGVLVLFRWNVTVTPAGIATVV